MSWWQALLGARQYLTRHAVVSAVNFGAARSLSGLVLKFGAQRAALGVAATGVTSYSVHREIQKAHDENAPLSHSVTLAEGQELAWLNAALKPIWDHLNAGLYKVISEQLEPTLRNKVPVVGRYLHFKKLTLGETPPKLGPVTVTRLSSRSSDGVELNIGFHFSGDLAVEFSAGVASIELVDLQIAGELQVALRPLEDALNPVGGVTISCLDRPTIDLQIRTTMAELVPNLYDFVRDAVDDIVAGLLVVPNGIAVPIPTLGKETDVAMLKYPAPKGLLRLRLHEVKGKAAHAPSAPLYVQTQIGSAIWRSPPTASRMRKWSFGGKRGEADAAEGLHQLASWANSGSSAAVQDFFVFSENQSLEVRLYSNTSFSPHALLGHARLPARKVVAGLGTLQVELQQVDEDGSSVPSGRILELEGEWLEVAARPPRELPHANPPKTSESPVPLGKAVGTAASAGPGNAEVMLLVTVNEASGLPEDPEATYFVRFAADERVVESKTGFAPSMPEDVVTDEMLLTLVRRLLPRLAPVDVVAVLGLPASSIKELSEHDGVSAGSGEAGTNVDWDHAWCKRARNLAHKLAASRQPQFHQIVYLPSPGAASLSIELVRRKGSAKDTVVARLEKDLCNIAASGGSWEGPFELHLNDDHSDVCSDKEQASDRSIDRSSDRMVGSGNGCMLLGSVQLHRLDSFHHRTVSSVEDVMQKRAEDHP